MYTFLFLFFFNGINKSLLKKQGLSGRSWEEWPSQDWVGGDVLSGASSGTFGYQYFLSLCRRLGGIYLLVFFKGYIVQSPGAQGLLLPSQGGF